MSESTRTELTILLNEEGVIEVGTSDGADLFALIVMAETAHQIFMAQYFAHAAAKIQEKQRFTPKLLVPTP